MSRNRVDYTLVALVVAALLLLVPVADVWRDLVLDGNPLFSTLLENSIILLLSGGFLAACVWIRRNDWDEEYAQSAARWVVFGTGAIAVVYGWVLAYQLLVQGRLKPYVVAADGVIIGGLAMAAAGVYSARNSRLNAARAAERERFAALFDNASDAIVGVETAGEADAERPVVTDVNSSFETAFGGPASAFIGQSIGAAVADEVVAVREEAGTDTAVTDDDADSSATDLAAVVGDPDREVAVQASTDEGRRDFLVDYVPIEATPELPRETDGFLVFTDVTEQRTRERQFEAISAGAESLLDARTPEDVAAATRALARELFPAATVRVDDSADPTATPEQVGTIRISDEHTLVVTRAEALSATEEALLDVLAKNARAAIGRVDRERRLDRRSDQLEFVNSLLRHDLQNSMTVIRSRGAAVADAVDGQEASYAETIVEESDEVVDLVDRFRSLLDALTDEGEASLEQVSLSAMLRDRAARIDDTYTDATVNVDVPDGVDVLADEGVGNVLDNVLRNAVEHNDTEEPTVTVTLDATAADDTVTVRIADDGPGVSDEVKATVFRRGERGLKQSAIGSGFGLFFVDRMMERYGGDVTVTDNDPRGAVFALQFRTPDGGE